MMSYAWIPTPSDLTDAQTIARAIPLLNSMTVTLDQVEQGNEIYHRALTSPQMLELPGSAEIHLARLAALQAWCQAQRIEPAELAAQVIFIRACPIAQWRDFGVRDLKKERPEDFAELASRPVDASTFGIFESDPRYLELERLGFVTPDGAIH